MSNRLKRGWFRTMKRTDQVNLVLVIILQFLLLCGYALLLIAGGWWSVIIFGPIAIGAVVAFFLRRAERKDERSAPDAQIGH